MNHIWHALTRAASMWNIYTHANFSSNTIMNALSSLFSLYQGLEWIVNNIKKRWWNENENETRKRRRRIPSSHVEQTVINCSRQCVCACVCPFECVCVCVQQIVTSCVRRKCVTSTYAICASKSVAASEGKKKKLCRYRREVCSEREKSRAGKVVERPKIDLHGQLPVWTFRLDVGTNSSVRETLRRFIFQQFQFF